MKKILLSFLLSMIGMTLLGQSPDLFKYQAVVRDNQGELLANQSVAFRISILQSSATGAMVYSEIHSAVTNGLGLVDLEIGNGSVVSGVFGTIDWSAGPYFLRMEMDETGGSSYVSMGTSQLLSVPYALHAESATHVDDADADPTNELNTAMVFADNTLEIADGGSTLSVDLGELADDNDWVVDNGKMFPYWTVKMGINNSNPQYDLDLTGTFRANQESGSTEPCALFEGRTQFWNKVGIMESNPQFDLDLTGTMRAKKAYGSTEPCALFEGKTQFWDKVGINQANPNFDLEVSGTFLAEPPYGSTEPCAIFGGKTQFWDKVGINQANPNFDLEVSGTFYANEPYGSTEPCAIFDGKVLFHERIGINTVDPAYDIDLAGTLYAHQSSSSQPCAIFSGTTYFDGPVGISNPSPQYDLDISGRMIVTAPPATTDPCALFDGKVKVNEQLGIGMDPAADPLAVKSLGDGAWVSITRFADELAGIKFHEQGTSTAQWIFPYIRGWQSNNLIVRDDIALIDVMTFEYGTGKVGIGSNSMGTYKLYVNGTAYSTGGWTSSDRRIKKNITPISGALEKVASLEGVTYDYDNSDYPEKDLPEGRHYGLIAQELEKVCPEMVQEGPDGLKAVAYDQLVPLLIEAVKEQQEQIDQLARENREMRMRYSDNGL